MNKVILQGRLTKDPEIRYAQGADNRASARFTIAVNRTFKNKDGKYDADFINCSAFGGVAEAIEKWFSKGKAITVEGEWRTGSYEKDGTRVYTNDCQVSRWEFPLESKGDGNTQNAPTKSAQQQIAPPPAKNEPDDDFVKIDTSKTGDLPFFDS